MANLSSEERRKRYSTIARKEDIEQSEARKDINLNTKADERRNRYASKDYLEKYNAYHAPTRYDGSAVNRYLNAYGLNQQRQADRMQEYRNRYAQQQFMNAQRDAIRNGVDNGNNPLGLKNLENPLDNMRRLEAYKEAYGKNHELSYDESQKLEKAYGKYNRQQLEQLKEHFKNAPERDYSGEIAWVNEKLLKTATGKENKQRQNILESQIKDADNRLERLQEAYADRLVGGGTDNGDYLDKVNQIKQEKSQLQNELNDYKELTNYSDQDDFAKYRLLGESNPNNPVRFFRTHSDEQANAIFDPTIRNEVDTAHHESTYTGGGSNQSDRALYRAITDEEADNYSYILGKYGQEEADKYLQAVAKHTDVNGSLTALQEAQEQGYKNPLLRTAESIGLGLITPVEAAKNLISGDEVRTYDDYKLAGRQEALRSGAAEKLTGGNEIGTFLYNTATSAADNLLRYAVGGGIGAVTGDAGAAEGAMRLMMGGQVMDSAMKNALDRGLSDSQAVTTALISAVNEELFETISLSNLKAMQSVTPKNYRELAKNIGKQFLGEGSEEMFTDIGNAIADDLVNGEKSEIRQNILNYMKQGMSEEEAKKQASVDFALQLVESGLSGGITGAAMGGAVAVDQAKSIKANQKYKELFNTYKESGLSEEDAVNTALSEVMNGLQTVRDKEGNVKNYKGLNKSIDKAIASAKNINENVKNIETEMNGVSPVSEEDIRDNKENIRDNEVNNEYLTDMQRVLSHGDITTDAQAQQFLSDQDEMVAKYPDKKDEIIKATVDVYMNGKNNAEVFDSIANKVTNTMAKNETSLESKNTTSEGISQKEDKPAKIDFKANVNGEEAVITSVNKDNMTVRDSVGNETTIPISDATMTDGASAAVEQAKQYGKRGSRLYLENMAGNIRNYTYTFNDFYNAGKQGKDFYGRNTRGLNTDFLREVYDAGVQDGSKASKTGGLIRNDARYTIQESEARVLDAVGKAFNVTIQMDHMLSHDANGYLSDGVIHISTSAEKPSLVVFSHEFTHRLEDTSPEAYKAYKDYVINYLKKTSDEEGNNVYETREIDLKNAYASQGVELSDKELQDELVANATESFLSDTDFIEDLVKENKSLAQQILDVLKQMLEDLKNVFAEKYDAKSKEGKALQDDLEAREEALKLWTNAIKNQNKEAVKKNDTRYSMKELETNYDNLAKEYDKLAKKLEEGDEDYYYEHYEELGDLEYDLGEIVEQYAKNKGFTETVYHGTQNFGFTNIDTKYSDDKLSFFATDDLTTADSYSNAIAEDSYVRKVSDKSSNAGNYKLYANTDNLFEIDGHGRNWNDIKFITDETMKKIANFYYLMNDSGTYHDLVEYAGELYDEFKSYLKDLELDNEKQILEAAKEIDDIYNNWNPNEHLDKNGNALSFSRFLDTYKNLENYTTREIAKYAKDKGYDGVIYKNIVDNGGRNQSEYKISTVYNFFNPQQQVKSADAVTYDDDGNVIPLSERFNKSNDDIRFSLKEDSEGNKLSPQQQEFFKDSKAVDDEGNLLVMYHGSREKFTEFNLDAKGVINGRVLGNGFYFTNYKKRADYYGKRGKVFKVYLNIKNPLYFTETTKTPDKIKKILDESNEKKYEEYKKDESWWGNKKNISKDKYIKDNRNNYSYLRDAIYELQFLYGSDENVTSTDDVTRILKDLGYDGIIFDSKKKNEKEMVAFYPNQIKNVDNENPTDNPDIRFSLKEESNINRNDVAALTGNNEYMAEAVNDLEETLNNRYGDLLFDVKNYELYDVFDEICKQYNIKGYSKQKFARNVKELFDYIKNVDHPDGVDTTMLAMQVAADMLDKGSVLDTTMLEMYPTLLEELRNKKIKISQQDRADLDGGYARFRRKYFGNLTLTDEGTEVDTVYEGLSAQYPELFPSDITHPADRLTQIGNVVDLFKRTLDHIQGASKEESAFIIAQDIINKAVLERTKHEDSIAKNKRIDIQAKVREQVANLKKAEKEIYYENIRLRRRIKSLESLNNNANNKIAKQEKEWEDYKSGKKQVKGQEKFYRKQYYEKLKEEFVLGEVTRSKAKNRAERQATIDMIKNLTNKLSRTVLRPSENNYVPTYLLNSMIDVLQMIDLDSGYRNPDGSPTKVYLHLQNLKKQYEALRTDAKYNASGEDEQIKQVAEVIDRIAETVKDKRVNQLTNYELENLLALMKIIHYQINRSQELFKNQNYKRVADLSEKARANIKKAGREFDPNAKVKNIANKYLNNTLSPVRLFKRLEGYAKDGALTTIAEELQNGERESKLIKQTANDILKDLYETKEARKLLEEFRTKKLVYKFGEKEVVITPEMRVALYLHSLNEDNYRHIVGREKEDTQGNISYEGGGVVIPNYHKQKKSTSDTLKIHQAEKYTGQDVIKLTPQNVETIIKDMDEYDRMIVSKYKELNSYITDKLNDTTEELYGYKKATVKNYFPIIVDKSMLELDSDVLKLDKTIENMGSLKSRVNSVQPIYLEGVMDAIERQIDQAALFSGMAIPVRDFKKVWGLKTNETTLNREAQKAMGSYIDRYQKNLQGDLGRGREKGDSFALLGAGARGKMAMGALTGNLSVVMKQAASYPTAAGGLLGYQDLFAGLLYQGQRGKDLEEIIKKYTPLYADRDTAGIVGVNINDMSAFKKKNPKLYYGLTGWIEAVDKATVRRLWYASENYVKRNFKYEVGSDKFYKEVAKVWEDTVRRTQPIYDTMNRPEYLRQNSDLAKFLLMFKTQSFQNIGILVDAVGEYKARSKDYKNNQTETNKKDKEAAFKQLVKATSSQIIQMAVFTAITAIADAMLHRPKKWADEETGLITPESFFETYFENYLGNMLGQLAFGDVIKDAVYIAAGKKYTRYDLTVAPLDAINDVITGLYNARQAVNTREYDKAWKNIIKASETASQYGLGVPVKNIENLYKGVTGNVADIAAGKNPLETTTTQQMYNRIYLAYQSGNPEIAAELSKNVEPDKIKTKMVSKLKEEDTIKEAAEYRYKSELDKYQAIVDAYVSLGFDEDWVTSAISSVMNKEHGTTGSGVYNSNDLQRAIDISAVQGSKVANEIYKEKYDTYKSEGMKNDEAKKKALSSVRSAITGKYKSQYESGTTSEKVKIRDRLCSLRVAGERLYTYDSMKSWNK